MKHICYLFSYFIAMQLVEKRQNFLCVCFDQQAVVFLARLSVCDGMKWILYASAICFAYFLDTLSE